MTKSTNGSALGQFNWFDPQRIIFICFFLLGSFGVVAIKEAGSGPIVAIAFSTIIMLGYIFYCGTRKYAVKAEILGDNIYYMGFLFTLVSLAYTLYKFTSADNEIDQIIKNFGIALTTTLIGVVGRVYFNQTKDEDPPESASLNDHDDDVDIDVDIGMVREMREAMSAELRTSQQIVESHVKLLGQSIRETGSALTSMALLINEIARSTEQISQQLAETHSRNLAQLARDTQSYADMNEAIRSDAGTSLSALDALQQGLERLSSHQGQLKNRQD